MREQDDRLVNKICVLIFYMCLIKGAISGTMKSVVRLVQNRVLFMSYALDVGEPLIWLQTCMKGKIVYKIQYL